MRVIAIGVLASVLMHGSAVAQTSQEQTRILSGFQASVAEFAGEHLSFEGTMQAPRIFTLPVATVFRQIIARTLDDQFHVAHLSGVGTELPLDRHPAVLEPFPAAERHEFPPVIARALPPLPNTLEYRLIGNDLVLREVNEDLIVAVLRDAVGSVVTAKQ